MMELKVNRGRSRVYKLHKRKISKPIRSPWSDIPNYLLVRYIDHRNLLYFHTAQNLNHCQANWSLSLSHFHFTLIHKPGKLMGKSDTLSHCPDHPKGEDDNSDITLLNPNLFQIHATEPLILMGEENALLEHIRGCTELDESISKTL